MTKKISRTNLPGQNPQEILFNQLYGSAATEEQDPTPIYRVRLACEVSAPHVPRRAFSRPEDFWTPLNRPIPGIFVDRKYCFRNTNGLDESCEKLTAQIRSWKRGQDNSVNVVVHNAECLVSHEVVHYVEMLPSKWFSGWNCPWREYNALRNFVHSLPEYQRAP